MSATLNRHKVLNNTRRMSGIVSNRPTNSAEPARKEITEIEEEENNVKVAIRCRPMSEKEINDGHETIVEFESKTRIVVHDMSATPSDQLGTNSGERQNISHVYDFDAVFDHNSSQEEVYDSVCRPIVDSVLQGYNGTIFAYGQTGTGKTFTMEGINKKRRRSKQISPTKALPQQQANGNSGSDKIVVDSKSAGIIPRTFEQIFNHVANNQNVQFLIRASYLEIYQEEIHDLLRKDRSIKLELHERPDIGVYVKDLTSFVCKSISEIERVMRVGNQNRMVGATDMNEHSSRSHAIFMITVEQQQSAPLTEVEGKSDNRVIKAGKLNLVDLAGSERQRKTNSHGQRQRESIKINLSLSALGNVINSLMKINTQQEQSSKVNKTINQAGFTPYRDSKLTRLLQDSLGGNSKTLMIANIGPASYNYDETINTLNYASRAKCIRNKPRLNEDPKDALLRELQKEIDDLRLKLAKINGGGQETKDMKGSNKSLESRKDQQNNDAKLELSDLKQKLSSLEGKLLNGKDHSLEGYTREQELELEKRRSELASQSAREKAIRDELERREEAELLAKESFSSIQQEVDAKRRLIRQILLKIKSMRDDMETHEKSYRLELDELDQLQYVLQKELKLKCLIMDNFVPNHHVDQLLSRVVYDEKRNTCAIQPIDLSLDYCNLDQSIECSDYWKPTSDCMRPRSEYEKIGETIYPSNIRFKYDNLIEPQLTLPKPTPPRALNLNAPNDDGKEDDIIQKLIDNALNQREPDVVI